MSEKKKRPGRPSLGDKAMSYPIRGRLPQDIGKELERQAAKEGVIPFQLAREDIVAGVKRRHGRKRLRPKK